jgi:hypothetical protein
MIFSSVFIPFWKKNSYYPWLSLLVNHIKFHVASFLTFQSWDSATMIRLVSFLLCSCLVLKIYQRSTWRVRSTITNFIRYSPNQYFNENSLITKALFSLRKPFFSKKNYSKKSKNLWYYLIPRPRKPLVQGLPLTFVKAMMFDESFWEEVFLTFDPNTNQQTYFFS